ncbi:MAG: hypothetical protein FWB80_01015 [Defluviitaleaceae bacterium]|nr:hypothetical protein [Defluviitaleaceae bacterium]
MYKRIIAAVLIVALLVGSYFVAVSGWGVPCPVRELYSSFLQNYSDIPDIRFSENFRDNGVSQAWLIDFNNDGIDELMFTVVGEYGFVVTYYVYSYAESFTVNGDSIFGLRRWFTGESTPFSTGPNVFNIATSKSGEVFLHETSGHISGGRCYFHSFAEGESFIALSRHFVLMHGDGYEVHYFVNDSRVDEAAFENAPAYYLGIISSVWPGESPAAELFQ